MNEIYGGILVLFFMILISGIKIVREHDRLVVFRFGKIIGQRGPGMQLIVPLIDQSLSVDTRITASATTPVEATTSDKIPVRLSALCRFYIKDPVKAVAKVDDPSAHTMQAMHAVLRNTISEHTAKYIQDNEVELNSRLTRTLNRQTNSWGVRIKSVEIKEMMLSQDPKETTNTKIKAVS